jgi:hypothetical protein
LELSGIRNFISTDFLIIGFFLIGTISLLFRGLHRPLVYFCLLAIFIQSVIYYRVNFQIQRYWTHLLPFFLIPAAYGFSKFLHYFFIHRSYFIVLISFFCLQGITTYKGLKHWQGGSWFINANYEQAIATRLAGELTPGDLLLVSRPEPYFIITGNNTHSISRNYPYIYINDPQNDQNIFIVNDAGMFQEFPEFASLVSNNLSNYVKNTYSIDIPFYSANRITNTKIPVVIYKIKLSELKNFIIKNRP